MSSRSLSPSVRRPRITSRTPTATPASVGSTAALVPRVVSNTHAQLSHQRSRSLSSPVQQPTAESYSLWQPILRGSDQIVLYNPSSHAINIVPAVASPVSSSFTLPRHRATNHSNACPYCHRPMDDIPRAFSPGATSTFRLPQIEMSPDYFRLLQDVNGGAIDEHAFLTRPSFARFEEADDSTGPSRRWSAVSIDSDSGSDHGGHGGSGGATESLRSLSGNSFVNNPSATPLGRSTTHLAQPTAAYAEQAVRDSSEEPEERPAGENSGSRSSNGYYSTFFHEETRLGMGANGTVFLCQHVLNGIPLGHFAVKKIAVGESTSYLMEILREVRLHEKLHHRNIITYHHAWIESARFSSFGLAVPTLHVLMQWAELGSLDDLILQRLGAKSPPDRASTEPSEPPSGEYQTREDRIRAFRARAGRGQAVGGAEVRKEARRRAREMKAVHLLSAEEIRSLFGDVVAGLAFLHESSFLHLDLKPGNVLLTLDEGDIIPRAMLSDFGTAQDALQSAARERSGNTGTLEYCAPESLGHNHDGSLRQITSKSDMWSLGMILHKLVYFKLPWKNDEDMSELEKEIVDFQGFRASSENIRSFTQRRLPAALCQLLSKLLDVDPFQRPGSDQVLKAIRGSQFDPTLPENATSSYERVGPLVRRTTPPSSRGNGSAAARYDSDVLISGEPGENSSSELSLPNGIDRAASRSQSRRRSDPVGEIVSEMTPRLLALDGPAPTIGRAAGLVSSINVPRVLSRMSKSALLISKTVLLINKCAPTPPKVVALSLVIGLALIDMWTRRMRWSCALLVAHLVLLWTSSRELVCLDVVLKRLVIKRVCLLVATTIILVSCLKLRRFCFVREDLPCRMASLADPDMEIDSDEDLEMDEELGGGSGGESSVMDVEETVRRPRFVAFDRPVDTSYGRPRLDALPTAVITKIADMIGLADVMALRRTNKALNKFTWDAMGIWRTKVRQYRQTNLIGADPVYLPQHDGPALQEELLRSAFALRRLWNNQASQLPYAQHRISQYTPEGILFVPDTLGRYFLVVSHKQVFLWTLEPDSFPQGCRRIFPWGEELGEHERIIKVLVTRPQRSVLPYLAIQYTLKDNFRLRTEIFQLHLSRPRVNPVDPAFGLVGTHMTEGALVAFTDFVLAYSLGDAAQKILLCCWVTRQATLLSAPVREWEVRWQHQSCRTVTIGTDIIVVVRDSTAEIYPRNLFTFLDEDQRPVPSSETVIQGDFEYLPPTYATDIAVFPVTFLKDPKIHIHAPRSATSISEGWSVDVCVRPISLIGVARARDPSVRYYVEMAKLFKTPTPHPIPQPSGVSTPNFSNPPSPSHTAPASPSHTAPRRVNPSPPIPDTERYKFVFHIHALQLQHPHYTYGPILGGPNGRGVILVTNVGTGGGPTQFILKFRHPTNYELHMMVQPNGHMAARPAPRMLRMPQTNAHLPPQLHPPPQPIHPQAPPQMAPPMHPLPHVQMGPIAAPLPPEPFMPLLPLMRTNALLDIMRQAASLWSINSPVRYELLAWDESGGSLLVGSRGGDLAVLECAFPLAQARTHSARA
ncbi:kinase domain protein [Ceratobasidium sp. AG-Ba]|nr:kinase domain protein [Ceratobasidium sp. AG-Ba]